MIHDPVYEWVAAGAVTPARAPRLLRPAHVRLGEDEAAAGVRDGRRGVVASRMVRKGEVVMVGYPSIIGRMRLAKAVSAEQERELVAEAVARLPGEAKAELLALAKEKEGEGKVEDVLKTNVFGIDVGGSQHFGVFPSLSVSNSNVPRIYDEFKREQSEIADKGVVDKPRVRSEVSGGCA